MAKTGLSKSHRHNGLLVWSDSQAPFTVYLYGGSGRGIIHQMLTLTLHALAGDKSKGGEGKERSYSEST